MDERRRERDAIAIPGDYQARAIQSPWAAQRFWHEAKLRLIDRLATPAPGSRVADAGCGSGVVAAHLAKHAGEVVGIDVSDEAIAFARRSYGSNRLRFLSGPFERLLDQPPFDGIYCLEVVEHLYPQQAEDTLRLFARAARPGAVLFVTTPNAHSAWPAIEWTLDRLKLVPTLAAAQHLTSFSARSLRDACTRAGWTVEEVGAFNGIAPFLAQISNGLARAAEHGEFASRRRLPWNLLYCIARRT